MIDYGCITRYYVELFYSRTSNDVLLTSEDLTCLHDAKEFVNWISHQVLGIIPYRIVEVTIFEDNSEDINPFPRNEMRSKATICTHYPPYPLYMSIKKKRRKEREMSGLYYSYS